MEESGRDSDCFTEPSASTGVSHLTDGLPDNLTSQDQATRRGCQLFFLTHVQALQERDKEPFMQEMTSPSDLEVVFLILNALHSAKKKKKKKKRY